MEPSPQELTTVTTNAAAGELDSGLKKITHCLDQLTDEQVWWRPMPSMNSIANLLLHLCGNVRQWIISGVGGAEDTRNRPQEFSQRGPIGKDELLQRLTETVGKAKEAMAKASAADLVRGHRVQSFEVTGIGAIFHSVSHFQGHTQEIIHMTRCQLGEDYKFDFVSKTVEWGGELSETTG
jgi:hypothetical protein